MRCWLVFICFGVLTNSSLAQYFQQDITYSINASYNETSHTIAGEVKIDYTNNSSSALDTIYLHLWANAFSTKSNSYTDQAIKLGSTEYYFAPDSKMGGYQTIEVISKYNSINLNYEDTDQIAFIVLKDALLPLATEQITIRYELQMPFLFDRLGWHKNGVQLIHWYPSIAVYDENGWHPMEYLSIGELYSSIGDYTVNLSLPFDDYVSTGSIDGSSVSKDVLDFAVIANEVFKKETRVIAGVRTHFYHDNPVINKHGPSYLEDAMKWMTETVGPYPHEELSIVEKGKTNGMEYSSLVTVGAKDERTFRYYLVHELFHQWFYGSLANDQRKEAWIDEGLTTYYQRRYYDEVLGEDYYSARFPKLHGAIDGVPLLQKMAISQSYRKFDQPICTHVDEVSIINYGLNSYQVPASWIDHLSGYIGQENFDRAIKSLYEDHRGSYLSANIIRGHIQKYTSKDLNWFFEDMLCGDWSTDYKVTNNGNDLIVENKSKLSAPYRISFKDKEGEVQEIWQDGHLDIKTYSNLLKSVAAKTLQLGPRQGLLDQNPANNRLKSAPIKLVPILGLNSDLNNEIYVMPLLNYNTSDGFTAGAAFYNSTLKPRKWKYLLAPQYGFQSGRLVGHSWTSYDQYLDSDRFRKIFYRLGIKSYDEQYSEAFDVNTRYLRIDPTVSLHFNHAADSHKYSKLTAKYIYHKSIINSQNDSPDLTSNIFQLRYDSYNFYELSPTDISISLEYQGYGDVDTEHYLKLFGSVDKSWLYSPDKSIRFRLFGSYHLLNSRRYSSSYDRRLTRGATALIHQGFNDYTYEESWYNRYNQNQGLLGRQVSYYGGGFKVPLGSQNGIGQTNDLAISLNFEADLPLNLPSFLPLAFFADVGYFTTPTLGLQETEGNTLFSTGVALNYAEGLFSIYLPLYNSNNIANIFESEDLSLLGRVSFRMDINRFNPWEIVEDYNF